MLKVQWITSQAGFSVVEALLAVTVFGFLSVGLIGAVVYGRSSTADSGEQVRADYLADEGAEAVRNIRGAGYANLVDGTYGLVQSSGTWTLSGSSDTSGIYARSVTIASNGTNRKNITSNVTWSGVTGSGQASVVTELTNWMAAFPKSWTIPSQYAGLDLTGTIAGYKVATSGSYAYLVRNSATGPNFFVINISTPTSPTVVGTLTLAGTPTNIAISGNYAYISNGSNSAELQIVSIASPTTPTLSGSYDAAGSADGLGVYVVGTTVYLSRGANSGSDEFVIVNAANPASPVRIGGYSLNVNMHEVYVSGTTAYVATDSDTQEVLVLNVSVPGLIVLGTSLNLSGATNATTIAGYGTTIVVGQGTILYTLNNASALAPTVSGSITLPGTINDLDVDATHNYVFTGTSYASGELQVVNVATIASPTLLSSVNMTGSISLTGVAYSATQNVVIGADSNTAQEATIFGPN
ncbi:MAG TPA: hypothetical protein VLG92_05425 [Candidatus Saccharimonadia bacterium]|nr:hypothetical protein [Candidatus Saccharimonadia bacterium]